MTWTHIGLITAGSALAWRQGNKFLRNQKRKKLTRVSINYSTENISMIVQDGLGDRFSVRQRGAYWYLAKSNDRLDDTTVRRLQRLVDDYRDEVKSMVKTPARVASV